MSSDTKSKNKISKKGQNKLKKMDELSRRRKNNEQSDDSDENYSSDSEVEEMDAQEYRKLLSTMFPSKHLNKKIKAGEKLKKVLKEEQEDYEEEEESDSDSDYVPPKKSKRNKKKIVESSEEEEEEEEEVKKSKKGKKSKKEKYVSESESEEETEESEDEEDDDEIRSSKKSNKYNIIFTIGGIEDNEDDWETEDDSEEDEESDETEDEDESIDSEEDEESDDEPPKKNKKNKKEEDTKKISSSEKEESKKMVTNNKELLSELTEIQKKHSSNKTIKKCIELCEEEIEKAKKIKDKKDKKYKDKNSRIFKKIIKDKNTTNDFSFFNKLEIEEQKKIIKELKEINKLVRIEKPYRMTLLESNIPINLKAAAMKKINSLRYIEPGAGEFYKIKNWVDTFMRMPFDKYLTLPINIDDGVEKCHDFMASAQKTLDEAVYGLNDAKMQIMQMLGQLITNPNAIGTAIAIHGPPGTGKTSLVKEGISKILNRPFAFIALGGATDSSFLEGHSYTYEGSTWGKIVQILIDSKCMNPVIYFDELDKISDTPKGE